MWSPYWVEAFIILFHLILIIIIFSVGSISCQCKQKPVDCLPKDGYRILKICTNHLGVANYSCKYPRLVGTTFSDEMDESLYISKDVSFELKKQLFNRFAKVLGVSKETGFNWGNLTSIEKSRLLGYNVSISNLYFIVYFLYE